MKNMIQSVFVLMALMLLAGCNSEGASNSEPQPPVDATVFEIAVTPSPVSVLAGRTQQLVAMAKFDDGTERDVSGSATWAIVGDPTIAEVSTSGLLTGNTKGDTELTATKDGITSSTVDVNVCDFAGPCIDIFDAGSGKFFTSSPSIAYLDSIGGSENVGDDLDIFNDEPDIYGGKGEFYLFNLDQAHALCATYNTQSVGGRTNWRLATRDELKKELYEKFGNMQTVRGWPVYSNYWTMTTYESFYISVHLPSGSAPAGRADSPHYVSCVSNP